MTSVGAVILCSAGVRSDADVAGRLNDYVFSSGTGCDVVLVLAHGMLYNHSRGSNLEYVQDVPSTFMFRAVRTWTACSRRASGQALRTVLELMLAVGLAPRTEHADRLTARADLPARCDVFRSTGTVRA